jgi:hypothetical protein
MTYNFDSPIAGMVEYRLNTMVNGVASATLTGATKKPVPYVNSSTILTDGQKTFQAKVMK